MEKKKRFTIGYFAVALITLLVVQAYLLAPPVDHIPYSEFKKLVREGKVKEVRIGPNQIVGWFSQVNGSKRGFVSLRVDDPEIVSLLEAHGVRYDGVLQEHWLRDLIYYWILPALVFGGIWYLLFKRMGSMGPALTFGRAKARLYGEKDVAVKFADVAGVDEAKEELKEIVEFLKSPDRFQRLGGKIPKGVLLVGPPGTGKTLLARAVAGEAHAPFFHISGSEFVEMFVGLGAARVRDLFAQAKEKAPCIIFIDELDALGRARGLPSAGAGHSEQEQTLNQLLVEMDGFDARKGVVIMAATNRPEILDPALLRPGRFDRHVLVDRPDIRAREAILGVYLKQVSAAPTVDVKILAARTTGFVGADLANLVNEAALLAARKNKERVEMADFEEAIDRIVAGLEKKQRVMSPKEREYVAYHEAGHALVASMVPHADPVHRISIIPRGIGALGYTLQLPTDDRYLITVDELHDRLAVLLGGRVAEEAVFGVVSTGAQDDLQKATDIARSMVKEYGMSRRLGPVAFERTPRSTFLNGHRPPAERSYSEKVAEELDLEIGEIIQSAYKRTRDILQENRPVLELVAKTLLQKEVLEGEELRAMLKCHKSREESARFPTASPEQRSA